MTLSAIRMPPFFPGARLCLKNQPQQARKHKSLEIFQPSSVIHLLRLALRTQSRPNTNGSSTIFTGLSPAAVRKLRLKIFASLNDQ